MGRYSAPPIITTYHILNYFLMSLTKMSPYHTKTITPTQELFHLLMSVTAFVQFQLLINVLPDKQLTECCDKWSYKGNFTLLFPKGVQTYTRVSPSPRPSSTFGNRNANPNKNSASDCYWIDSILMLCSLQKRNFVPSIRGAFWMAGIPNTRLHKYSHPNVSIATVVL
jgi:hypothetical protein